MLSSWGVKFEDIDVEARPEAMTELAARGVPRVPATVRGEAVVHGWNPKALAELVGVRYVEGERLSPDALARRLDTVLAAAARAMRQIPPEHLDMKAPDRDRTVRRLGYHVFRLTLAFREGRERGDFPASSFDDVPPAELRDGETIARYGETVRERLAEFFARPGWCDGDVETYYGRQSAHELMERTTWHAAQHLRQLYWFLDRMGIVPDGRLTDEDLAGLPFPRAVWS